MVLIYGDLAVLDFKNRRKFIGNLFSSNLFNKSPIEVELISFTVSNIGHPFLLQHKRDSYSHSFKVALKNLVVCGAHGIGVSGAFGLALAT